MNYEQLNKHERIRSIVKHLANTFGEGNFKVKDHWQDDLTSIGLTDKDEKYLIYISTYGENDFFVSLENSTPKDDLPYEPAGDFDNLNLNEVEKIFRQHLKL